MVYIDTEMKFSERRLIQIMKHQAERQGSAPTTALSYEHLLNRIHVIRPQTGVLRGPEGLLPHAHKR